MTTHYVEAIRPNLPLCAGMAYLNGEGPGSITLRVGTYFATTETAADVDCPDCAECLHA